MAAVILGTLAGGLFSHPLVLALFVGLSLIVLLTGLFAGWLTSRLMQRYVAPAIFQQVVKPVWNGTSYGVEKSALGFGRVMLISYKAVKSNTCPRIEVDE